MILGGHLSDLPRIISRLRCRQPDNTKLLYLKHRVVSSIFHLTSVKRGQLPLLTLGLSVWLMEKTPVELECGLSLLDEGTAMSLPHRPTPWPTPTTEKYGAESRRLLV